MLERSGYDMTEVETIIQADKEKCSTILEGKELLFLHIKQLRDLIEALESKW